MSQLTYTTEQLAKQLNTSRNFIYALQKSGLLEGIKKGNGHIYSCYEVEKFLKDVQGYDISNIEAMENTFRRINRK